MPVTRYVAVPAALTEKLQAPAAPAFDCTLPNGRATVCVHDGLMRELQWQALLARANEDRATTAFLSAGSSLQPAINSWGLAPLQSQLLRQAFAIKADGAQP